MICGETVKLNEQRVKRLSAVGAGSPLAITHKNTSVDVEYPVYNKD